MLLSVARHYVHLLPLYFRNAPFPGTSSELLFFFFFFLQNFFLNTSHIYSASSFTLIYHFAFHVPVTIDLLSIRGGGQLPAEQKMSFTKSFLTTGSFRGLPNVSRPVGTCGTIQPVDCLCVKKVGQSVCIYSWGIKSLSNDSQETRIVIFRDKGRKKMFSLNPLGSLAL